MPATSFTILLSSRAPTPWTLKLAARSGNRAGNSTSKSASVRSRCFTLQQPTLCIEHAKRAPKIERGSKWRIDWWKLFPNQHLWNRTKTGLGAAMGLSALENIDFGAENRDFSA